MTNTEKFPAIFQLTDSDARMAENALTSVLLGQYSVHNFTTEWINHVQTPLSQLLA
ncbi:hypothetical protein [Limnobacter sp.]|uniref:hypothetical protein n=1 Tax=Limnobacter sp. TaxID=2003368 RepID=UPI00391DAE7A